MNHEGIALITSASCGLGMAFARELADRHHNLVLATRSIETASKLRPSNQITVLLIATDLCRLGAGQRLAAELPTVSIVWRKRYIFDGPASRAPLRNTQFPYAPVLSASCGHARSA